MRKLLTFITVLFISTSFTIDAQAQSSVAEATSETTVGASESAYEEFTNASINGDSNKVSRMMINGEIFNINAGTKVKIVDHGFMTHTIRVLEGTHSGKTGIVAVEHVE